MPTRRNLIRTTGVAAAASILGSSAVFDGEAATSSDSTASSAVPFEQISESGEAAEYVRNVEEMRGHFHSSVELLSQDRLDGAELHASHGPDYFATVLPPLRNADPDLATRLRGQVVDLVDAVHSMSADEYATHVTEDVLPLLDQTVETVVSADLLDSTPFDVRIMNALAGRISDEYNAAVTADGEIVKSGEYWDGRGFLYRIEQRFGDGSAFDSRTADALSQLRSQMESVEAPMPVRGTTLQFQLGTSAAVGFGTSVGGRETTLTYVRNADEIRGHLHSSIELSKAGDHTNAALHASHGPDYVMTVLTPVYASAPKQASQLLDRLVGLQDRARSMDSGAYEQHVTQNILTPLDEATASVVPDQFANSTSFQSAVILALADRVDDEYAAAVPEGEAIDLYGEYWDARGFLSRMEDRFADIESDLDSETQTGVSEELTTLREELETARPAWDVSNSVDRLHELLSSVAEA